MPQPSTATGVDRSTHGLTELRVHGVSGTPAASMLDHPAELLVRLDGDERAGFYRRWFPGGTSPDTDAGRIEAYSWGGLTSGPASRALWLLFLPFVLVDLAHWMLPPVPPQGSARTARLSATLLRLVALGLTLTFLLTAALVFLDLVAWQCAPAPRCARRFTVIGWLSGMDPGQRLALAALAPAAIVVLLWRLGRQELRAAGAEPPPGPDVPVAVNPLADRRFWDGDVSELHLRAVHVSVWCSALGALVLAPAVPHAAHLWGKVVLGGLLALHLGVLLACVAVTCSGRMTGRGGARADQVTRPLLRLRYGSVALLASGLLATALVPVEWPTLVEQARHPTHLPVLRGALIATYGLELLLVLALIVAVGLQRPWRLGAGRPGYGVALKGFAAAIVGLVGWLLATTFSAGVGLAVARSLGVAVSSTQAADERVRAALSALADPAAPLQLRLDALQGDAPLILPPGYFWTGTAVVVMLVAFLAVLVAVGAGVVRATRRGELVVTAEHPGQVQPARARQVARGRALAGLTDRVDVILGPLVVLAAVVVVVGAAAYALAPYDAVQKSHLARWTALGVYLTALGAAGLVSLGFLAFRNPRIRRYVGILWDVATFWPRANHPLTPPCYGERAVPELDHRVARLTSQAGDVLVLSGHSQGSILAASMVMRRQATPGRVALLTYGTPLRRLYARFFPSYFGPEAFALTSTGAGGEWISLWAPSDPVGSWVMAPEGDLDVRVLDPTSLEVDPGTGHRPPVCGHSGYPNRAEYATALARLAGQVSTPPGAE